MSRSVLFPFLDNRPYIARSYRANILHCLVLILACFAAVWLGLVPLITPPSVVSANDLITEFSAVRAMEHLRVIAKEPHPMGTPQHQAVEQYLVNQLKAMGLKPQVQSTTSWTSGQEWVGEGMPANYVWAGNVRNILVRIPGTANTRAILLTGWYDAMPTTPGAGDGASGVAVILETVRAILAGQPLKNDIIIYLGDADVNGLLGPKAFIKEHPWAKDYAVAMSFISHGTHGASVLYYTTPENGWLVEQTLKVAPHPLLYSFVTDLSKLTGAGDLSEFLKGNTAGLSFAYFIDIFVNHSALDNPQRVEERSVQHNGSYALALTRHLGNLPLTNPIRAPQLITFNILPNLVIVYPETLVMPLAGLAIILFITVVVMGLRRRQLTVGGIFVSAVLFLANLFTIVILTSLLWSAIKQFNPKFHIWLIGIYDGELYLIAFIAFTVAVMATLYNLVRVRLHKRHSAFNLVVGALLWWLLLTCLTSFAMPATSYLFTLPLLLSLLILAWVFFAPTIGMHPWLQIIALVLNAAVTLVLLTPVIYLLFIMTTGRMEAVLNIPLIGIPILFVGLIIGILLPHLLFLLTNFRTLGLHRWSLPAMAALSCVLLLGFGMVNSGFSAEQPRTNHIAYILDADKGKATWVSAGEKLDTWTQQFFSKGAKQIQFEAMPSYFPGRTWVAFEATAPKIKLPVPQVTVLKDTTNNGVRELQASVSSQRQASNAIVDVSAPGDIIAVTVNGKSVAWNQVPNNLRRNLRFIYFAIPNDGVELTLSIKSKKAINIKVTDYSYGLPQIPGMSIKPRSADMIPAPFDFADPTIVTKSFKLT
ncbi:hypothetical protein DSM106972_045950 [Dulcicalothrix desertica PCC 7102]|uniref:Peptidase M28 domain-containing protein n=1 Tax=Dulcicalothrix desertica PCC 7102 TaxID=232991 RepID=A0A433VE88_9CYAN|nr:M28 family peptidase [Dulcicalothrix desertica]RUT04367.1 hypothetical protein DSM106972_045950 [Dulcicalothrix desertica PCC 7102]